LKNSPLESSFVVVARIENYNTSKPLKFFPEKSQILSYDTVVANERYIFQTVKWGKEIDKCTETLISVPKLTFWLWNFLLNFSTPCM
jgi:hypothetical protein